MTRVSVAFTPSERQVPDNRNGADGSRVRVRQTGKNRPEAGIDERLTNHSKPAVRSAAPTDHFQRPNQSIELLVSGDAGSGAAAYMTVFCGEDVVHLLTNL